MNRLLLCALPLALCSVVFGQPEERPTAPITGPPIAPPKERPPVAPDVPAPTRTTPVGAVRCFVADLQGDYDREWFITAAVDGARPGYYGGEGWNWAFSNLTRFDWTSPSLMEGKIRAVAQGEKDSTMGTVRKHYSKEFKEEAVKLVLGGRVSLSQASRDLDINQNVLRRWTQESQRHGTKAFPGQGVPLEEELVRLRRENEVLRLEREILKKAVRIFSQAPP